MIRAPIILSWISIGAECLTILGDPLGIAWITLTIGDKRRNHFTTRNPTKESGVLSITAVTTNYRMCIADISPRAWENDLQIVLTINLRFFIHDILRIWVKASCFEVACNYVLILLLWNKKKRYLILFSDNEKTRHRIIMVNLKKFISGRPTGAVCGWDSVPIFQLERFRDCDMTVVQCLLNKLCGQHD